MAHFRGPKLKEKLGCQSKAQHEGRLECTGMFCGLSSTLLASCIQLLTCPPPFSSHLLNYLVPASLHSFPFDVR